MMTVTISILRQVASGASRLDDAKLNCLKQQRVGAFDFLGFSIEILNAGQMTVKNGLNTL